MADIRALLDKLEKQQKNFFENTFIAPVVKGGRVTTRIAGVVHTFAIANKDGEEFEGWAILRPLSYKHAEIVEEAQLEDIAQYLKQFPILRVILAERRERFWIACPVNLADARRRFGLNERNILIPAFLVQGAYEFEQAIARFDGAQLWFEDIDPKRDPQVAEALRSAFLREERPEGVHILTFTPEERMAYAFALGVELEKKQLSTKERLEQSLARGGARLLSYEERGGRLYVRWQVGRNPYTSLIAKDNLWVVSPGICLVGGGRNLDLTSLVSVVKEGERRGLIHRVQARGYEPEEPYDYEEEDNDY